ncbi:kielin/chordin-like protein isoform X2 [Bradysia coprophila]|uniref:kielin/chordin-like protein isoform X2 n=1 Tax=Bradysia coprophila TaxID=38358 RepID=UPI00187D9DA8|nr:kielin/chordin-like protein isoform X2 [Bradysia coprophila]
MNFKNVTFAIFCCLLAGFSLAWGDDKSAAVTLSSNACFRRPIRQRGCCHNGIYIPEGQTKTVAPCQYGMCTRGRVNIAIADCPPLQSGCRYESSMTECCKLICDVGCTYNGILIAEGETKTIAPCEFATCINGELGIMVADCAAPEEGCRIESTMEYCCKKICDVGCKYNGTIIPEGETLKIAPCKFATCMNGEIGIAIQDCARPREGCRYEPTIEECCNMICDDGCMYFGEFIPEGQTLTVAPCQYATCLNGEVELAVASCPRPQLGCRYESTLEECCKTICDEIIIAPDVE